MSQGWMRVREAADLLSVSESTVRRRIAEGQLRGRTGKSGRREVFLPAKLRRETQANRQVYEKKGQPKEAIQDEPVFTPDTENTSTQDEGAAALPGTIDIDEVPPEELVKRYERLAGGSLMLAQKRADELHDAASAAYENLAHARGQLHQVRKLACIGWGASAVAILIAVTVALAFGISAARTQAYAEANKDAAEQAQEEMETLRDQLQEAQSVAQAADLSQSHAAVVTE